MAETSFGDMEKQISELLENDSPSDSQIEEMEKLLSESEKARQLYVKQSQMHASLILANLPQSERHDGISLSGSSWLRWSRFAAATALSVGAVMLIYFCILSSGGNQPGGEFAASNWVITPVGDASFERLPNDRIKLHSGQIAVRRRNEKADGSLEILTAVDTEVSASGSVLVSFHPTKHTTEVYVQSGRAELATLGGRSAAERNSLLVSQRDAKPICVFPNGTNAFACKLFQALHETRDGINISCNPFSAAIALTIIANGADREISYEIERLLGVPANPFALDDDPELSFQMMRVHTGLRRLIERRLIEDGPEKQEVFREAEKMQLEISRLRESGEFRESNRIFSDRQTLLKSVQNYTLVFGNLLMAQGATVREEFQEYLELHLQSVEPYDIEVPLRAVLGVKKIAGEIDPASIMLVNNMSLHCDWAEQFDSTMTSPGQFVCGDGTACEVEMMNSVLSRSAYGQFDMQHKLKNNGEAAYEIVKVPFKAGVLECFFVIPKSSSQIGEIISDLTPSLLSNWNEACEAQTLGFSMPRLSCKSRYQVRESLEGLGLDTLFKTRQSEDFARMIETSAKQVRLAGFQLNSLISFDESGMSSRFVESETQASGELRTDRSVVIDRPFLFFVTESSTNTVLRIGVIQDPRSQESN